MREKRKPSFTQHLNADKRRCLSWNMYDTNDAGPSTSQDEGIHLIREFLPDHQGVDDDVPQHGTIPQPVLEEAVVSQTKVEPSGRLQERPTYQFQVTRSKYLALKDSSKYELKVHFNAPREEDRQGLLCCLDVQLNPVAPAHENQPRPQSLPSTCGSATLLLREAPGFDFLVFDDCFIRPMGPVSRKDVILGRDSFLSFSIDIGKRPSSKCLNSFKELHTRSQGKLLHICLREYDGETGLATLEAWLLTGIVTRPAFAAQCPHRNRYLEYVHHVMNWFHGFPVPVLGKYKFHKRYDYNALFDKVRQYHQTQEEVDVIDVQHPMLVPILRPYQRDAVCWMVMKEKVAPDDKGRPHVLWKEFKTVDDKTLYYNPESGEITDQKLVMPGVFPGGILADEMGLGKTVEVLATILANPRWGSRVVATTPPTNDGEREKVSDEKDDCREASGNRTRSSSVIETASVPVGKDGDVEQECGEQNGQPRDSSDGKGPLATMQVGKNCDQPNSVEKRLVDIAVYEDMAGKCADIGPGKHDVALKAENSFDVCVRECGQGVGSVGGAIPATEGSAKSAKIETCKPMGGTENVVGLPGSTNAVTLPTPMDMCGPQSQGGLVEHSDISGIVVQSQTGMPDQRIGTPGGIGAPVSQGEVSAQRGIEQQTADVTAVQENRENLMKSEEEDTSEADCESEEPKIFQCICGRAELDVAHPACVKCLECSAWQHAACVSFQDHMPAEPGEGVQYWCPHCFPKVQPIQSGATLIISPAAICPQWVDEINRHINSTSLKVMVYTGVKKQKYIQPKTLAEYDIVITTYNTLQTELDYANMPHPGKEGRNLRHAKRYMTTPSPMPCVEWWRVCLDEAQMIESPTAKSAEMANRLSARNRWCVTGTPIQKTLDDLYGLFLFLGVEPVWVKHWWDLLLSAPYSRGDREPLQKALCKVFWRTAKRDVIEQIALPPQTEDIHWLDFSPIETYFYQRKHEECSRSFTFHSHKTSVCPETKLSTLDRKSLQTLLGPLLRVRQACCHPHVVRGEFTTLQKKKQLSMKDLLTNMIGKAEVESDGAHRQLVCAVNGLAAVHCIKNEVPEAVQLYREVLSSAEENKAHIKTDRLQLMHAIHNLRQILLDRPEVVDPMSEDGDLPQKMDTLRDEYLMRTENLVISSLQTLQPIRNRVMELQAKIPSGPPWYLDGIQWVVYQGLGQELVERLKTELEADTEVMGLIDKFRDVRGFQFVIVSELDELAQLYKAAWAGVTSLNSRLQENALLAEATDCHLRPFMGRAKLTCAFCRVEKRLQKYEMKLFSFDVGNMDLQDLAGASSSANPDAPNQEQVNPLTAGPRGTWAANDTEKALRILHGFLKLSHADENTLDDGSVFLEKLEQQRKEFKPLRAYWGAMKDRVAAMDELEMAMLRLRVKLPGEETDPASQPYIIEPLEVDQQRYKFLNDRLVSQNDLRRRLGQLVYLQNLCKAQYDLKEGRNPEPCPICVKPLGVHWTVLQCGHCFCQDCMEILLQRAYVAGRQRPVRCAVCRTVTEGVDISYVSTALQQDPSKEENSMKILGDHSTKIEAVVRTLKMIQLKEPGAKALVFSTWAEVLDLISKALDHNNVTFRSVSKSTGSKHFQTSLMDFKQEPSITALLLPVHSGSKGLNIVEATHVLLVEPILNPASEMQAIGRVHRIGQTKPTVVHRFLVHNTIEEKLHSYLRTHTIRDGLNSMETDTGDMTLADLKKLFASET